MGCSAPAFKIYFLFKLNDSCRFQLQICSEIRYSNRYYEREDEDGNTKPVFDDDLEDIPDYDGQKKKAASPLQSFIQQWKYTALCSRGPSDACMCLAGVDADGDGNDYYDGWDGNGEGCDEEYEPHAEDDDFNMDADYQGPVKKVNHFTRFLKA